MFIIGHNLIRVLILCFFFSLALFLFVYSSREPESRLGQRPHVEILTVCLLKLEISKMNQKKIRNLMAGIIGLLLMPTQGANAQDFSVNGNLTVDFDAYIGGFLGTSYLDVFGDAYIDGILNVGAANVSSFLGTSYLDVSNDLLVNGNLEVVAPSSAPLVTIESNSSGAGAAPFTFTSATPDATTVGTILGTTIVSILSNSSGSVLLESNGDLSLLQPDGAEETVEFFQVTTFDVFNVGQPSAGLPVAGSQRYVAGYGNGDGVFVALSPEFLTQLELDVWIANADFTDPVFAPVRSSQILQGSGGNLHVEGSAHIESLEVDGIADVGAAIAANTQAIALNAADSQNISSDLDVVETTVVDNAVAINEINAQHQALLQLISEVQDQYAGLSLGGVALNPDGANSLNVEFVIESSVDLETWTPIGTVSETVDTTGVPKQFIRVRAVDSSL